MKLSDFKDPDIVSVLVEIDGIELKGYDTGSTIYHTGLTAVHRKVIKGDLDLDDQAACDLADRKHYASLVTEWNLDDELTSDSVAELFRLRRDVYRAYQEAAFKKGNFTLAS